MRIAALFHVSFEKLGHIEDWIIRKGHTLDEYHLYDDPRLPQLSQFDFLIIMGGPMSVHDDHAIPWLKAEKVLISECIDTLKPMMGICLGAQLIALQLGSSVTKGKYMEIGWFPVKWNREEKQRLIFPGLPEESTVFHWHGDMFDLPPSSLALASSSVTPCQAFISGRHIVGVQFHLEVKPENISLMMNYGGDLPVEPFVQDQQTMSEGLEYTSVNRKILEEFLEYFDNLIHRDSSYGIH